MNRKLALQQIIAFGEQRNEAVMALAKYGWEPDFKVIKVGVPELQYVLNKYVIGDIRADDLELWANFIECRDELDYSAIEGYIYALADPEQMGDITLAHIERMIMVIAAN